MKVTEHKMCALIFSTTLIQNTSHFKKNSGRYCHKCTYVFIPSTFYSCQIVIKACIFSKDFQRNTGTPNSKKVCPVGAELFHAKGRSDGRTERHEEANSRFTQFIERTEMGMTLQHLGESQQIRCG
jgi:hypothetical protein